MENTHSIIATLEKEVGVLKKEAEHVKNPLALNLLNSAVLKRENRIEELKTSKKTFKKISCTEDESVIFEKAIELLGYEIIDSELREEDGTMDYLVEKANSKN